MFAFVNERLGDDKYKVLVTHMDHTDEHIWTEAELHAKVAEGMSIGGVSDDGITVYDTYRDFLSVEVMKLKLFEGDWIEGCGFRIENANYSILDDTPKPEIPYCLMGFHTAVTADELCIPEWVHELKFSDSAIKTSVVGSLIMPDSLEKFSKFTGLPLQFVRFPTEVAEIPAQCIDKTPTLQKAELPKKVRGRIRYRAFGDCVLLQEILLPYVQDIDGCAFSGCTGVTSIQLGEVTGRIGVHAFYKCAIQELHLPRGIKAVHGGAFDSCKKLKFVSMYSYAERPEGPYGRPDFEDFPKNVFTKRYEQAAKSSPFSKCTKLTNVEVLDGGEHLQPYMFAECEKLVRVTLPDTIKVLPDFIFWRCNRLQEINLPKALQRISRFAFKFSLRPAVLHEGIRRICREAFYGSRNEASETTLLPNSLKCIEESAFSGSDLKHITIPASVREMGEKVFWGCQELESVVFENFIDELPEYLFGTCISLKKVVFTGGIRRIPQFAFSGCISLLELDLPNTVERVDNRAFHGSSIRRIIVHSAKTYLALQKYDSLSVFSDPVEVVKDFR